MAPGGVEVACVLIDDVSVLATSDSKSFWHPGFPFGIIYVPAVQFLIVVEQGGFAQTKSQLLPTTLLEKQNVSVTKAFVVVEQFQENVALIPEVSDETVVSCLNAVERLAAYDSTEV